MKLFLLSVWSDTNVFVLYHLFILCPMPRKCINMSANWNLVACSQGRGVFLFNLHPLLMRLVNGSYGSSVNKINWIRQQLPLRYPCTVKLINIVIVYYPYYLLSPSHERSVWRRSNDKAVSPLKFLERYNKVSFNQYQ